MHLSRGSFLGWVRRAGTLWAIAGGIALSLAAIQVLPAFELLPHTTRASLAGADASFGSLPPALLVGAVVPTELEFPEWYLYPGIVTVLLAFSGWARGWTTRERGWAVAGLLALLLSLGPTLPPYAWALDHVPGMSLFRVSARWWLFALFALAILAARALDGWRQALQIQQRRFGGSVALIGLIYLGGWGMNTVSGGAIPLKFVPHIGALFAAVWLLTRPPKRWIVALLVLVLTADLWWASYDLVRPASTGDLLAEEKSVIEVLRRTLDAGERSLSPGRALPQGVLVEYGLEAADGYDPFQLAPYAAFVERAIGCPHSTYAVSVPAIQTSPVAADACGTLQPRWDWLALLNIRTLLLTDPFTLHDRAPDTYLAGDEGEWRLYDLGGGLGRAFGVSHVQPVLDSEYCLDELEAIDVRTTALVEGQQHTTSIGATPVVLGRNAASNRETFTVRSPQGGFLVRSTAWAPGWRVQVDGHVAPLLRVDCALQGVWLDPSAREVQFEYAPRSYQIGRWISLTATTVLVTFAISGRIWCLMRKKPSNRFTGQRIKNRIRKIR